MDAAGGCVLTGRFWYARNNKDQTGGWYVGCSRGGNMQPWCVTDNNVYGVASRPDIDIKQDILWRLGERCVEGT